MDMSYNIDRFDLNTMSGSAITNLSAWSENLGKVSSSIQGLIDTSDFAGEGADAVKSYLSLVHQTILGCIASAIGEYCGCILMYNEGFSDYDEDDSAIINEEYLGEVISKLNELSTYTRTTRDSVQGYVDGVVDILSDPDTVNLDSADTYAGSMEGEKDIVDNLKNNIAEYDSLKLNDDGLSNIKDLIDDARSLIDQIISKGVVSINAIKPEIYVDSDLLEKIGKEWGYADVYITEHNADIGKGQKYIKEVFEKREEEYNRQIKEAKRKRIEHGVVLVAGVVVSVIGIVTTCGALAPAEVGTITTIATYASAGAIMINNMSDLEEGAEEIYNGCTGDLTTPSTNFMRDKWFDGDTEYYNLYKALCVGANGACGSINQINANTAKYVAGGMNAEVAKMGAAEEVIYKTVSGTVINNSTGKVIDTACSDNELLGFALKYSVKTTSGKVNKMVGEEIVYGSGGFNKNLLLTESAVEFNSSIKGTQVPSDFRIGGSLDAETASHTLIIDADGTP